MIRAIRITDDVQDEPIFINDESDPLASLDQRAQKSAQPCTGNAVGSGNGQIGIGQQRKFQVVFLGKLLMRPFILCRHAKNCRTTGADLGA